MGRPRKIEHINLPNNVYIRYRKRKNSTVRYYTYRLTGNKEISLGTDYNHACLKASQMNIEREEKGECITFTMVAKRYRDEVIAQKKASTAKSNLAQLKPLLTFFQDAPLDEIEPQHVRQYMDWRKDVAATANNEYSLFNHIWGYARQWGYTKLPSPAEGVKKYPIKRRDNYVEDHIYQLIYQYANQDIQDLMNIAYLTGQRPVDVVSIQRKHISDGFLHIAQQKTQAKLRIELVGKLAEILNRRLEQPYEYLFFVKNKAMTADKLAKVFARLRRKVIKLHPEHAGALQKFQFRDLRAKSGTDKAMAEGEEAARQQLGHTTVKMTKSYIRKAPIVSPLTDIPSTKKGE